MNTLDLEEAAAFLKCSDDTIRELVASGQLPGAKVGRKWVFIDVDLLEWLRTKYASQGAKKCQSTNGAKRGGYQSHTSDREGDALSTELRGQGAFGGTVTFFCDQLSAFRANQSAH